MLSHDCSRHREPCYNSHQCCHKKTTLLPLRNLLRAVLCASSVMLLVCALMIIPDLPTTGDVNRGLLIHRYFDENEEGTRGRGKKERNSCNCKNNRYEYHHNYHSWMHTDHYRSSSPRPHIWRVSDKYIVDSSSSHPCHRSRNTSGCCSSTIPNRFSAKNVGKGKVSDIDQSSLLPSTRYARKEAAALKPSSSSFKLMSSTSSVLPEHSSYFLGSLLRGGTTTSSGIGFAAARGGGGVAAVESQDQQQNQATQQIVRNLANILENCMNPNPNLRNQGEHQLERMVEESYPSFVTNLVHLITSSSEITSIAVKQQAGLYLKNSLWAKEESRLALMHKRWLSVPPNIRAEIKQGLMHALQSGIPQVQQVIAQVIAKVFAAEVAVNGWPSLVPDLARLAATSSSSEKSDIKSPPPPPPLLLGNQQQLGVVALTTLGYVCEEMKEDHSSQQDINEALTAIIASMTAQDKPELVYAAVNALKNAIHLTARNFQVAHERDMIMKMLCQAASSSDIGVRTVGFESLGLIAERFYSKLGPYMEAIYTLSVQTLQSRIEDDDDSVAVVAIEFWSTLAEVEDDILYDNAQRAEMMMQQQQQQQMMFGVGRSEPGVDATEEVCMNYIKAVAPHLVPVLNIRLTRQDELDDDSSWTSAKAAAACLELMTRVAGADVMLEYVMPLVHNVMMRDYNQVGWREKEAALMALGSVIDASSSKQVMMEKINPQVLKFAFHNLVVGGQQQHNVVILRDTSAWFLSRVAQYVPESLAATPQTYEEAMAALVISLDDTPRVATRALSAIFHLAQRAATTTATTTSASFTDNHNAVAAGGAAASAGFRKHYSGLVRKLHQVAERHDGDQENLSTIAFESIMQLIRAASMPTDQTAVEDTLNHAITRAHQTFNFQQQQQQQSSSIVEQEKCHELQTNLIGVIESSLAVLGGEGQQKIAEKSRDIMHILFSILQSSNTAAHQDCLRTAGLLAASLGRSFSTYMSVLWPYLARSLQDTESGTSYITAVLTVSDVTRALEEEIYNYCDEIVSNLLKALSSPNVESRAKPPTLSAIGDIALAISGKFVRYSEPVLNVMQQATQFEMPITEPEAKILRNELWEGLLTAYSGIIIGLKASSSQQQFDDCVIKHTSTMITFILKIAGTYQNSLLVARGGGGGVLSGNPSSESSATLQGALPFGSSSSSTTTTSNSAMFRRERHSMEAVLRASCDLLGDIAAGCSLSSVQRLLKVPLIEALLNSCSISPTFNDKTKEAAQMARQRIFGTSSHFSY